MAMTDTQTTPQTKPQTAPAHPMWRRALIAFLAGVLVALAINLMTLTDYGFVMGIITGILSWLLTAPRETSP